MLLRIKYITTIILLLPIIAAGQSLNTSGYLKFFAHPNLNKPYPFERLGTRLQLKFSGSYSDKADFFSALDFNLEETKITNSANEPRSAGMQIYPVETYIDFYLSDIDIRIGNQFIFWGRTDWINPTDNINPWDYKNISAEIEDYRIPVTAIKVDYYFLNNWTLEGVWIPHFLPNKIPFNFPDSIAHLPVETSNVLPQNKFANSEFGFHLSSRIFNIDYSLSYYNGFDKNPSIIPTIIMNKFHHPKEFLFEKQYHPYQVFGADFVTTFDKFSIKGEGAYFLTEDRNGNNVLIENPHIKYVLGTDYYLDDNITLNFQFIQTILFKYDKNKELLMKKEAGIIGTDTPDKYTQSISAVVQYNPGNYISVQFISVLNLKDDDYFILPIINYNILDAVNVYAGATIFGGSKNSPFGKSKQFSKGFFEIKYSF